MTDFIFDEKSEIENMINKNCVNKKNIRETINKIARYNYFVLDMDADDNYNAILGYITDNNSDTSEESLYSIIDECIRRAPKRPLRVIDDIIITKEELAFIKNIDNNTIERILFSLLATAKYLNAINSNDLNTAYLTTSEIFKIAKVAVTKEKKIEIMQYLYGGGFIEPSTCATTTAKKLTYVYNDGEPALKLNAAEYRDLGYTYMAQIYPKHYRRCAVCGKYIKIQKGKDIRVCNDCRHSADTVCEEYITKTCIDCECKYPVLKSAWSSKRCPSCYDKYRKKYNALIAVKLRLRRQS